MLDFVLQDGVVLQAVLLELLLLEEGDILANAASSLQHYKILIINYAC